MAEQQFNPGVSLAGAVDLEALKHQVKAEPGQAGGAPAAGGYVIDTTENTFQAMVQTSATFPILLLLWVPTDDRLFPMARALGDAVERPERPDSALPYRYLVQSLDCPSAAGAGRARTVRVDCRPSDAAVAGPSG